MRTATHRGRGASQTRAHKCFVATALTLIALAATGQIMVAPTGGAVPAPPALLGTWGTPGQCMAEARGRADAPHLRAHVIGDQWLSHGVVHCLISWQGHRTTAESVMAMANLRCGEDALREYRVRLTLRNEKLRIRWSDQFTTAALERCG